MKKEYIGDSVYVDTSVYDEIVLTTENGVPSDPSNTIILDTRVWKELIAYIKAWQEEEVRELCMPRSRCSSRDIRCPFTSGCSVESASGSGFFSRSSRTRLQ